VGARRWLAVTVVLAVALTVVLAAVLTDGCAGTPRADHTSAPATAPAAVANTAGQRSTTLLAAGDIASCACDGDEQTAALLDTLPGTVLTLGDTVYDDARPTSSGAAICRAGVASATGPIRPLATTTTRPPAPAATSGSSGHGPASPARAGTALTWDAGI
jgi:hypothetical protein